MTTQLSTVVTGEQTPAVRAAIESAKGYLGASMASNTTRVYRIQWEQFTSWCEVSGLPALPAAPGTLAAYFAHLADSGKKTATIDAARAAIRKAHETAGHDDPTAAALVKQTLKGIRREKGTAPTQKAPVLTADLRRLVKAIDLNTLKGKRDRALLLLGFAMGSRRSELVNLTADDIEETPEGLVITIRRSKTDQEGRGIVKGIVRGTYADTCPVSALFEWTRSAGITSGPIFRNIGKGGKIGRQLSAQSVALVIKEACRAAKLDPNKYSGHSLRAGLVTQAAKNKASVTDIMRQTGHRSSETVNRYIRKANLFEDNVSAVIGL